MLTVSRNNKIEPIADYKNFSIEKEKNDVFSISLEVLNTDNNKYAFPLIQEEAVIEYSDHEFRIKILEESRFRKTIKAVHTFFDLKGVSVDEIKGGTLTIQEAFSFLLDSTEWTFEIRGNFDSELIPNFGNDKVLGLIWVACEAFDADVDIKAGKHLIIGNNLGRDDDFQFRYKNNIKALKRSVDTSEFGTRIVGRGTDGLVVEYISPLEDEYRNSNPDFKPIYADEIKDDRIKSQDTMLKKLKRTLQDVPEINIELETAVLGDRDLFDYVWLLYEPLGIEIKTQVIKKTEYPDTPYKNKVELGDKKRSFSDLMTEQNVKIDENNKEVHSRIEQTNDRITLEVEEIEGVITGIEISVGQIESYVENEVERIDGDISSANSRITQTASSIRSEVNSEISRVDGRISSANSSITQLSNRITSEVNTIDSELGSMSSSITQLSNSITSKITTSEAESIFEQKAGSFNFTASQINFNGAVFGGNATFTGTLSGGQVEGSSIWVSAGAPDFLFSNAMDTNPRTQGVHVYVRPSSTGEARATVTRTTDSYRPFRAKEFITDTSLRENKRNIDVYDLEVLDTFRQANAYLYNRKNEGTYTKKQLGLMIDEMPYEVLSERGDSLGLYSLVAFLFRGIKQLVEEIDGLKAGDADE